MKYTFKRIDRYFEKLEKIQKINSLIGYEKFLLDIKNRNVEKYVNNENIKYLVAYVTTFKFRYGVEISFYYLNFFVQVYITKNYYGYKISMPSNYNINDDSIKLETKKIIHISFEEQNIHTLIEEIKRKIDIFTSANETTLNFSTKMIERLKKYRKKTIINYIKGNLLSFLFLGVFIILYLLSSNIDIFIRTIFLCFVIISVLYNLIHLGFLIQDIYKIHLDIVEKKTTIIKGKIVNYVRIDQTILPSPGISNIIYLYVKTEEKEQLIIPYCSHFFDFIPVIMKIKKPRSKVKVVRTIIDIEDEYSYEICYHSKVCLNLDLRLLYYAYKYAGSRTYIPEMHFIRRMLSFGLRGISFVPIYK